MKEWQEADAARHLGKIMTRALKEGPQRIRRGGDAVIALAGDDYEALIAKRLTFTECLLSGPSLEGVDLTRDQRLPREVDFGFSDET